MTALHADTVDLLSTCQSEPSIPYKGIHNFNFEPEQYSNLEIKYETREDAKLLSIKRGTTVVVEDKDTSDISVDIDVKLSDDELQDTFFINQTTLNDKFIIHLGNDEPTSNQSCATINIVIKVPHASALKGLDIGLINNDYTFDKEGLVFEHLQLNVVSGDFNLQKSFTSGSTKIAGINSNVKSSIHSLSGDLVVTVINGRINANVNEITTSANTLKLDAINGAIDVQLPTDFESQFKLDNMNGRRTVKSSKPDQLHITKRSFGKLEGYNGRDSAHHFVSLSTLNGPLSLKYIL
ncbi:uncharacterized protein RHIMIDRAFT_269420 [Rhizopus microsporus ATCC 52813]|uniref:Uncharacterized protein n=2 Tax=Rhizopus microsporus TaxID=58291 RepID=A0A2G4SHL7_RHIZD|nr:uncharacterized protein RHIMIDRAFT_269420 [Rhizopus microsporus ATCC 52813]PHZ08263.1 hypothetical protein RHIMIDRAFT_269420 [Rhizopus microsporus ATCC 52813]